jgi:hypothetical protein
MCEQVLRCLGHDPFAGHVVVELQEGWCDDHLHRFFTMVPLLKEALKDLILRYEIAQLDPTEANKTLLRQEAWCYRKLASDDVMVRWEAENVGVCAMMAQCGEEVGLG